MAAPASPPAVIAPPLPAPGATPAITAVADGYNPVKYAGGSAARGGSGSGGGGGSSVASQPSVQLARHVAYAPDRAMLEGSATAGVLGPVVAERGLDGGKVERRYADGTRIVTFRNGTEKETAPTGVVTVRFNNGDVKQTWSLPLTSDGDGSSDATSMSVESYLYADSKVVHSTYANGLQAYEFPSGQLELHRLDGVVEVIFPDGTRALRDAPPRPAAPPA